VKSFAPVSPPRAVADETEVPFHVNAAHRDFQDRTGPRRRNLLQCSQAGHGRPGWR
jgi:hypothetical protein